MSKPLRPSQLDIFTTCQRKWGYIYLDNIPTISSPAAQLGTAVHKVLENYLIKNQINYQTNEGRIASAGLGFLPKDIPHENIEQKIKFQTNGLVFSGTPDFFKHLGDDIWLLGDHKTCSSFRTALTPEELKTNVQANIYAQWLFQEKKAQLVKLNWIYYRTKIKTQAKLVEAQIKKAEQPSLFWPHLEISSRIMAILKQKTDSLDLPKNLNSCFKYGRCPFYGPCRANQKPASGVIKTPMGQENIFDKNIPNKTTQESFHLFVDCTPVKNLKTYDKTIELSDLLKPVLQKINLEKNIAHYRLVGYGQHVGVMAHYLQEYLKTNSYNNRTAILSSAKTPEGIDTLQTLSAAASCVIRGY